MQTVFPYMACLCPSVSSRKQVKSQKMDLFSSPRAEVGVITFFLCCCNPRSNDLCSQTTTQNAPHHPEKHNVIL